jgi:hypothetical protein
MAEYEPTPGVHLVGHLLYTATGNKLGWVGTDGYIYPFGDLHSWETPCPGIIGYVDHQQKVWLWGKRRR